jgi:hypothetical protein
MLQIHKQDINELPIAHWSKLSLTELDQVVRENKLDRFSSWLLPQLVAQFGTWKVYGTCKETVLNNCATDLQRAQYRLTQLTRSALLSKQVAQPEYGQLTPLVMLGLRRAQGIPYEHWRHYSDLEWFFDAKLFIAATTKPPTLTTSRLLELQQQGLITQGGETAGKVKNSETTYGLSGLKGTELDGVDKLQQMMLCQTWLAHPKRRRETMILDPNNWDVMPKPLIDVDLFEQQPLTTKPKLLDHHEQSPWAQV